MKWIKCSERMPEEFDDILFLTRGTWINEPMVLIGSYDSLDNKFSGFSAKYLFEHDKAEEIVAIDVTHWMPLPEGPED